MILDLKKYTPAIIFSSLLLIAVGLFSLNNIPTSLLPIIKINELVIIIGWEGRTGTDIEQELVAPLEKELSEIPNLKSVVSIVSNGGSQTYLTFNANTDMKKVYSEVQNKISQAPNWPITADKPVIFDLSVGDNIRVADFFLRTTNNSSDTDLLSVYENNVAPLLTATDGISRLRVSDQNIKKRLNINFDPDKLIEYNLTIDEILNSLRGLYDGSGNKINIGSRSYQIVFDGKPDLDNLNSHIIKANDFSLIKLSDVAKLNVELSKEWSEISYQGNQAIYFYALSNQNSNLLETMKNIRMKMADINQDISKKGFELTIRSDDSKTIKDSIQFIQSSIFLGVLLMSLVVYLYIRDIRALFIVLSSIPFSLALVAIAMWSANKQINLISLTAISLSVGLIVDAAIIAIESVKSKTRESFSVENIISGVKNVQAALISSTLTSIIILLPILIIESNESDLFEDLAFIMGMALIASIIYAIFVLPALCHALKLNNSENKERETFSKLISKIIHSNMVSITALFFVILTTLSAYLFFVPEFDLLPNPKSNAIMVLVEHDPSLSVRAVKESITTPIKDRIANSIESGSAPKFGEYSLRCATYGCKMQFTNTNNLPKEDYIPWVNEILLKELIGVNSYIENTYLFSLALPDTRSSEIDLYSKDGKSAVKIGSDLLIWLKEEMPDAMFYENSELTTSAYSVQYEHDKEQLAYSNIHIGQFNDYMMAMTSGLYIDDFFINGKTIPVFLKSNEAGSIDILSQRKILTEKGEVRFLSDFTKASLVPSDSMILRVNQSPVASIYAVAPDAMPIGKFNKLLKNNIRNFLDDKNHEHISVQYRGSSDDMTNFISEMTYVLALSILVLFGLIWWFLRSTMISLIVMMTVPISIAGSIYSLHIFGLFRNQNLDMITSIGFVMLMGLVINNGILLASQYINEINNKKPRFEAVIDAFNIRSRAIIISTLTSILGTIPLLYTSTASSEVYQGLAIVIIGGMTANITLGMLMMIIIIPKTKIRKITH